MQLENASDTVEAVVLIERDIVARELLYPEFEAILDGYVSESHYKGQTAKAVYLVINSSLRITTAVFFVIGFDEKGMADARWNVPLRTLAEASSFGPDLGAGPIRLTCFSQCNIEMQRNNLWDPQMEPGKNDFSLLKETIKANRLGLVFKAPTVAGESQAAIEVDEQHHIEQLEIKKKLHEHYSQELRDRLAVELKSQRLRISTLQSSHQNAIKNILKEHQQRVALYQQHLHALEQKNVELKTQNATIKETLDIQAGKVQGIREYYAHKLKMAQFDETSQVQAIQENIGLELEMKIQAATRELSDTLDMRNVELFYRHQNEASLKEEIIQLKEQYQALLSSSGEQVLTRLHQAGVGFVVFHPGVGQFTVALEDLSRYLDNPIAFAAHKLDISDALYASWLNHCQQPSCTAVLENGEICGHGLAKVDSPLAFHLGENDRCVQHQALAYDRQSDNSEAT